jgi:hypothetical protein
VPEVGDERLPRGRELRRVTVRERVVQGAEDALGMAREGAARAVGLHPPKSPVVTGHPAFVEGPGAHTEAVGGHRIEDLVADYDAADAGRDLVAPLDAFKERPVTGPEQAALAFTKRRAPLHDPVALRQTVGLGQCLQQIAGERARAGPHLADVAAAESGQHLPRLPGHAAGEQGR